MNLEQENICKTLLYAKIFGYPISKNEIIQRLGSLVTQDFDNNISILVNEGIIFNEMGLYSLIKPQNDVVNDKARAIKFLKIAQKQNIFLKLIPSIQYMFLSGSLSKGYVDTKGDIDYFIISKKNRVWTTKFYFAVLIRFYKLFNAKKLLCVNYIVDTDTMKIQTKNIFTATELISLIPINSDKSYHILLNQNRWIQDFFPNTKIKNIPLEKSFSTIIGDKFESSFRFLLLKKWKKTEERLKSKVKINEEMAFERKIFKHHHNNYMYNILNQYQANCKAFENEYSTSISY